MSNHKTLYIVGAGASSEVNLPVGYQLKEKIAKFLDRSLIEYGYESGDDCIRQALDRHIRQENLKDSIAEMQLYIHAAELIIDAMPLTISIDNFINIHSDNKRVELCGKLAIVRSILDAERNSLLHIDDSNFHNKLNFKPLEETWYSIFVKFLTEDCPLESLSERLSSICLIVFNYDRCIEHFLCHSFQRIYGIQLEDAAKLVNEIEIYHPYGVVGNLPWQGNQAIEFGQNPSHIKLLELASQIKTFTEGTDPESSEIIAIRNSVSEATRVVFLGFAYHKLNMSLILPEQTTISNRSIIYGTAYGMSKSDCAIIKREAGGLANARSGSVNIRTVITCYNLFKEYERSLSMV